MNNSDTSSQHHHHDVHDKLDGENNDAVQQAAKNPDHAVIPADDCSYAAGKDETAQQAYVVPWRSTTAAAGVNKQKNDDPKCPFQCLKQNKWPFWRCHFWAIFCPFFLCFFVGGSS